MFSIFTISKPVFTMANQTLFALRYLKLLKIIISKDGHSQGGTRVVDPVKFWNVLLSLFRVLNGLQGNFGNLVNIAPLKKIATPPPPPRTVFPVDVHATHGVGRITHAEFLNIFSKKKIIGCAKTSLRLRTTRDLQNVTGKVFYLRFQPWLCGTVWSRYLESLVWILHDKYNVTKYKEGTFFAQTRLSEMNKIKQLVLLLQRILKCAKIIYM